MERTARNHPQEKSKPSDKKDLLDLCADPERLATLMEEWVSSRTEDSEREAKRRLAENDLREAAVAMLGWYGPEARAAVPLLLHALHENASAFARSRTPSRGIDPDALVTPFSRP